MGGFGREVRDAMTARAEHLAEEGIARRQGAWRRSGSDDRFWRISAIGTFDPKVHLQRLPRLDSARLAAATAPQVGRDFASDLAPTAQVATVNKLPYGHLIVHSTIG
jgi:hypothetical protein